MVRWDIFEDHFAQFINIHAKELFDDEVQKESRRIEEFRANIGLKILDNNYGFNNPDIK